MTGLTHRSWFPKDGRRNGSRDIGERRARIRARAGFERSIFAARDDFLAKLQRIKAASISLRFIRRWWVELSIA
jgi:hypothetical protein